MLRPTSLRCEHRVDPLGIGERWPRLGWALESDERGAAQSAYRIVVAPTERDLENGTDLRWDSGEVASDRTIDVRYAGAALAARSRCWWKVAVRDRSGTWSPFSAPGRFELGLLDRDDWWASWIARGEPPFRASRPPTGPEYDDMRSSLEPSPFLRRAFQLERPVRAARLYATARGVHELHLNGTRVGDDVLAPGWTDYRRRIQYQTYDVTDLLHPGENVLGAILGDGWYAGCIAFDPKRRGALYGPRPQLLAQLEVDHGDGTYGRLVSDGSWAGTTGPLRFSDLLLGEEYDARLQMPGWDAPGFDASAWYPVATEPLDGPVPVPQPDEGVRVGEEVPAVSIHEVAPGRHVFDLGQNLTGRVRLRVRGAAGTVVTLRHAEVLNPDGTLYTTNLRFARATDRYVLRGDGEEVYAPHFTFHGFRYVEVSGYPGVPAPAAVTGETLESATAPAGTFACSDDLVNQLHHNIVWGQRDNFLSIPTDCPQRDERLGWLGDAQIFARTATTNRDVQAFFTKWLDDVADAQRADGCFPDVAPLFGERSEAQVRSGAPAWGDAGVIVPWTIYKTYGDTGIVERHWDAMTRWMRYLRQANPGLLRRRQLGNNYGDWLSPEEDRTPRDLLATAYWAHDAALLEEMARAVGRHAEAIAFRVLWEGIRSAFVDAYVDRDGRVAGDTQTGYVLALHLGLLPDGLRRAVADHLVAGIERAGGHLTTGFVGVGYLCPVLSEIGRPDLAYRLLTTDTYPSWGFMIRNGATTIWERWDGWTPEHGFQSPNMNSFNHYSLGSVGEWLHRYVAGIDQEPASAGFSRIVLRPQPGGGLRHARAEYDSVRGRIVSGWRLDGDRFTLEVEVPPNTTATVLLPVDGRAEIREGAEPLERAHGVRVLARDAGQVRVGIGSGTYTFSGTPAVR